MRKYGGWLLLAAIIVMAVRLAWFHGYRVGANDQTALAEAYYNDIAERLVAIENALGKLQPEPPKPKPFNGLKLGGEVVGGGGDILALRDWEQMTPHARREYVDSLYGAGAYDREIQRTKEQER